MRVRGAWPENRGRLAGLVATALVAMALPASAARAAPPPTCGPTPPPGQPGCQLPGAPTQGPNGTLERGLGVQVSAPSSAPYPDCGPSSGFPCVLTHSPATITGVSVNGSDEEGHGSSPPTAQFNDGGSCAGKANCSGKVLYLPTLQYLVVDVSYQYGTGATDPMHTYPLIGRDRYLIRLEGGGGNQGEPRLEALTLQEPIVRTGRLSTIGANGTTDGNQLKVTARMRNPTTSPKAVTLTFKHPYSGTTAPGGQRSLTLPAGGVVESSITYDTSGWAWTSAGAPNPQVDVSATMTVGSSPSSKTVTLPVHPKPLVLVNGLYSDFSTWHAYLGDGGFPRSAHPGWRGYAVGDGQAPGVMNTDPLDRASLSVSDNAKQVRTYVDGVRDKTNAAHVDLVAHSLGGLISRRYIHSEMPASADGRPVVSHLVMMGVPNLGSVCGDILNTALVRAGRPTPPPQDLLRLAAPEFNREVVPPAGIPFSSLVGNSDLLTCGVPGIGDAFVEVPSARWTVSDTETLDMKHVEMTSSFRAFLFAKERVDDSPGNQIDDLHVRATAAAAATCPASALKPVQLKSSAVKQLKAHRTTKVAIPLAKAKRLNVVVTAPFSVRALLRDPKGKVRARSAESADAGGGVRTLSVTRPRAGTWRLELVQTSGRATPAAVATLLTGSTERLTVKAKRGKAKTLVVTARAKRGKRTLRRLRVTGRLSVPGARTRKLKLLDTGRRGDRQARDGTYTARVRKAPAGGLVVAVDAKGKGFSSTSVASVCGR